MQNKLEDQSIDPKELEAVAGDLRKENLARLLTFRGLIPKDFYFDLDEANER
jgi:hypothetical protein